MLTDSVIDLMKERADVAIRAGPLREQRLVARKLGQSRMAASRPHRRAVAVVVHGQRAVADRDRDVVLGGARR